MTPRWRKTAIGPTMALVVFVLAVMFRPLGPADAAEEKRGTIELFTGCLGEALEGDTLKATIRVLNGLGPAEEPRAGARVKLVVEAK